LSNIIHFKVLLLVQYHPLLSSFTCPISSTLKKHISRLSGWTMLLKTMVWNIKIFQRSKENEALRLILAWWEFIQQMQHQKYRKDVKQQKCVKKIIIR
jgi:hypothetical protein